MKYSINIPQRSHAAVIYREKEKGGGEPGEKHEGDNLDLSDHSAQSNAYYIGHETRLHRRSDDVGSCSERRRVPSVGSFNSDVHQGYRANRVRELCAISSAWRSC